MMFNQDILLQVASRMDNQSLRVLSHTSLWNDIKKFASDQFFWKMRVEHLIGRETSPRDSIEVDSTSSDWKKMYYILQKALKKKDPLSSVSISNAAVIKILLDLGHRYIPRFFGDHPLVIASSEGHLETVRLFLEDNRIEDTSLHINKAIELTLSWKREGSLRLLLEHSRVDITEELFSLVLKSNSYEIMTVILDYVGGMQMEDAEELLLEVSNKRSRSGITRALVSHPLVELSSEVLELACKNSLSWCNSKMLDLLVNDSRMNLDSLMKTVRFNREVLQSTFPIIRDSLLGFYKYRQESIYTLGYYRSLALMLIFRRPSFEEALKWIVENPNREMSLVARDLVEDRTIIHKSDLYTAYRGFLLHSVFENIEDIRQVLLEEGARSRGIDLASALVGALLKKVNERQVLDLERIHKLLS